MYSYLTIVSNEILEKYLHLERTIFLFGWFLKRFPLKMLEHDLYFLQMKKNVGEKFWEEETSKEKARSVSIQGGKLMVQKCCLQDCLFQSILTGMVIKNSNQFQTALNTLNQVGSVKSSQTQYYENLAIWNQIKCSKILDRFNHSVSNELCEGKLIKCSNRKNVHGLQEEVKKKKILTEKHFE